MWTSLGPEEDDGSPSARSKHSATLLGNDVFLLGGRNGNLPLKDFWRYDLVQGRWSRVDPAGDRPPCLQEHTAVAHKESIFVFGGELGFSAGTETPLWIYHVKTNTWRKARSQKGVSVPAGRRGHTAIAHRGAMLVYGGYQDLRGSSNELWAFHFDTESWHLLSSSKGGRPNDLPPARHRHSAVLHDDSVFVYGGMTDLQERADLWKWDTVSRRWSCVKSKPSPGALHGHAACKLPGSMLVFGGERDGHPTSELWRFHFGTTTWERITIPGLRPNPCADGVALAVSQLALAEAAQSPSPGRPQTSTGVEVKADHREVKTTQEEIKSDRDMTVGKVRLRGSSADRGRSAHGNRVSPCEKKYVFRPTSVNYVDGSANETAGKRTPQTPGTNASFLKEITKLSQMNLSRLSHNCSYSVLTTNVDESASQESLVDEPKPEGDTKMTKSQSANVISRRRVLSAASPDGPPVSILRTNRKTRIPRDVTSVPEFGAISTLPTPVLTPIEITRLVFLESDDDVENDAFEPNVVPVEPASFSALHQKFEPGSKRSDSYNSHLVSHSRDDAKPLPKSASVRFRKTHSVVEIEDLEATSDYASNENMNRITSVSSYSMAKSPEEENVRTRTNRKDGPFGFSNPNYLGPDVQTIIAANRKTWHVTSPDELEKFRQNLNSPPDSLLEDGNGRSISRQFCVEEAIEMAEFESPRAEVSKPPRTLALSARNAPRASSVGRNGTEKNAERRNGQLYVFVVGGKENAKVTSYRRPVAVWRLQLAANVY